MYGQIFEDDSIFIEAGKNDCKFVSFTYNPNGGSDGTSRDVLDLNLKVGGLDINHREFEVTKGYPKTIKNPLTGVEEKQSEEDAKLEQEKSQQLWIRSILSALEISEDSFKKAMGGVNDWKSFCLAITELTKTVNTEDDYEVILQYKGKYLSVPNKVYITGKVLRKKDSDQAPLKLSEKLNLTKEGEEDNQEEETTNNPW